MAISLKKTEEAYQILINNECLKYHELYNYIFTYLNVKSGNETQMNNNQYYLKQGYNSCQNNNYFH